MRRARPSRSALRLGLRLLKRLGQYALHQVLGGVGYVTRQRRGAAQPLKPRDPTIRRILVFASICLAIQCSARPPCARCGAAIPMQR